MKHAALALLLATTGCSLGQGTGRVHSDNLIAHGCWGVEGAEGGPVADGAYELSPDFFAAVTDQDQLGKRTLQIRVQRGTDLQEVSDGLVVLIDDVGKIRERINLTKQSQKYGVTLPIGVRPPGAPSTPPPEQINDPEQGCPDDDPCPPLVHMALYLQRSCHNQNIVLYAISGTIEITHLFSGDPNEAAAADKLIEVKSFEVQVGDPRDANAGDYASDIPPEVQSTVEGYFTFFFERGQPGQPFP